MARQKNTKLKAKMSQRRFPRFVGKNDKVAYKVVNGKKTNKVIYVNKSKIAQSNPGVAKLMLRNIAMEYVRRCPEEFNVSEAAIEKAFGGDLKTRLVMTGKSAGSNLSKGVAKKYKNLLDINKDVLNRLMKATPAARAKMIKELTSAYKTYKRNGSWSSRTWSLE